MATGSGPCSFNPADPRGIRTPAGRRRTRLQGVVHNDKSPGRYGADRRRRRAVRMRRRAARSVTLDAVSSSACPATSAHARTREPEDACLLAFEVKSICAAGPNGAPARLNSRIGHVLFNATASAKYENQSWHICAVGESKQPACEKFGNDFRPILRAKRISVWPIFYAY